MRVNHTTCFNDQNMSKEFLQHLVETFGADTFSTDGKVLICKKCAVKISIVGKKRFTVLQHVKTQKHQKNVDLVKAKNKSDQTVLKFNSNTSQFNNDLCFVSYNLYLFF